jgi:hypothetical protein
MGSSLGPNIVTADLDIALDATSRKAVPSTEDLNMLDYTTWFAGNTAATGFSRNGNTNENALVIGTGPFGETTVLWEGRSSGDNYADGGWNGSYYSIDNTKTYRFSVWVRRTSSSAGGTFYLGTNGGGECVYRLSDGSAECNPYWDCRGAGGLTQNQWYLVMGHVHPYTYNSSIGHPNTGFWTRESGKVFGINQCNIGQDCRSGASTTSLRHRTYLYYSADSTTVLQWAYPRMDLVDGTEPSPEELLEGYAVNNYNLANISEKFFLGNKLRTGTISSTNTRYFDFDGTNDFIKADGGTHSSLQRTIEMVFSINSIPYSYTPIAVYTNESSISSGKRIWLGIQSNKFQMHGWGTNDPASNTTISTNTWYHAVYAYDQGTKKHYIWINGVLENNLTNTEGGMTGWSDSSSERWYLGRDPLAASWTGGAGEYTPVDIGIFRTYDRILTNNEVTQNFQSIRKRFNI